MRELRKGGREIEGTEGGGREIVETEGRRKEIVGG